MDWHVLSHLQVGPEACSLLADGLARLPATLLDDLLLRGDRGLVGVLRAAHRQRDGVTLHGDVEGVGVAEAYGKTYVCTQSR